MSFKILDIDIYEHAVVIDWGDCIFKHELPEVLVNEDISKEEVMFILEDMRPTAPPIASYNTLKEIMQETNPDGDKVTLVDA